MLIRFGRHWSGPQMPFSGRYLTRLFILAIFCVAAIVALSLPRFRAKSGSDRAGDHDQNNAGRVVRTDLVPSPFGELGTGVIVSDGLPKQPEDVPPENQSRPNLQAGGLPAVDRRLLQHVLDKTGELSQRPYYHLVTVAAQAPVELLEKHARRDITFAHLWNEPESHRGELIYLKGYLRALKPLKPADNEFFNPAKLQTLYEGYLFTEDSRPNPYVIVVPSVAEGMPLGANMAENVTFTGYFLKLWRYKSADGAERAAPLLIGRMVTWTPAPHTERTAHLSAFIALAFILLVTSVGGILWALNRKSRHRSAAAPAPDPGALAGLAELEKLPLPDPIQELGRAASAEEGQGTRQQGAPSGS